jgi:hypothetical protein
LGVLLPRVEKTRNKEQTCRTESQVDHGEQAALESLIVEGEQADHHEPEVADAAERQESAKILLDQSHDGPIENRRQSQRHDDRDDGLTFRRVREQRNAKPDEAECPKLQPSQHHRHANRAFEEGVREPGVEGEHRGLEREAEEQQPENEDLLAERDRDGEQFQQVKRVGRLHMAQRRPLVIIDVQEGDAHQHEDATK